MSVQGLLGYAGDILAVDAFRLLSDEPASVLIDVRTNAEWAYVGAPDLQAVGKAPLFLEWQTYPALEVDAGFVDRLASKLAEAGVARGAPLLFLCRSGARSRQAAVTASAAGWSPCFNIADGFEGPLDSLGHRNGIGGWRAAGLPWRQT
ncbi:MAG: hypothetical protein JOZ27_07390 [Caulobacteraceae bacterium]|nr:hypothetical protein [Caulobacteraceae bacterium]